MCHIFVEKSILEAFFLLILHGKEEIKVKYRIIIKLSFYG